MSDETQTDALELTADEMVAISGLLGATLSSRTAQVVLLLVREMRRKRILIDGFDDMERLEVIFRFKGGNPQQMQIRSQSFVEDIPAPR